jgi:hypothetical protein
MHKLTCFPLGNADCSRIDLENGTKILFDYANVGTDEDGDLRIDLETALREDLEDAERDSFDVVAFTHFDADHIQGASDFFHLDHAAKYQGEGRINIDTLWVPAAAIVEENLSGEASILRAEARHRLRQGAGIRVFSRPGALEDWLESVGLTLESRRHLITDAGQIAPGFSIEEDEVEFFVHSPFSKYAEDGSKIQRNAASLVMQATFRVAGADTRILLSADTIWENWEDIVGISQYHGNDDRLEWDVFKLPHHCSYKSLSSEKGETKTTPTEKVQELLDKGQERAIIISSSLPIPSTDETQPPHFQAAATYKKTASDLDGEFVVTMEHPKKDDPKPLVVEIDSSGATRKKAITAGVPFIVNNPAPRAG